MKIGDLVKVRDIVSGSREIQMNGMIGAISSEKYWIFNNDHLGNRPRTIKPENFGYKYSWVVLKSRIPHYVTITPISIDDYNKEELREKAIKQRSNNHNNDAVVF